MKNYFRVSIGIFDTFCREICCEEKNFSNLPEDFIFEGGGTNFDDAIKLAKKFVENSISKYDYFVVALLSDGESMYDKEILDSLKNIP